MELPHLSPGELIVRRFLIPSQSLDGSTSIVAGDIFHHMVKVLRLKKGAKVVLADGHGNSRPGIIDGIESESATIRFLQEALAPEPATSPAITIYQGLPKGDKIELIVQKATELGASAIIPFMAERSVKKIQPGRVNELVNRWQRISMEAARQSGCCVVPRIRIAGSLSEALRDSHHELKLLLWEEERTVHLKQILDPLAAPGDVAVIIGPEGGITTNEAAEAARCEFTPVSLGKRILRTESASLVILSILQYHWGDIGGC